ncbi:sensor histidine kinase [Anaeromyxobacter terrae]|uniref:sensor histidine kinase n=1 Tax=Anaeromyxobacter terrae TaxID=2925406 RepID=UPI001F562302|nr:PAS domain-containing protein [Anaeromyxobacter sp. SG22]
MRVRFPPPELKPEVALALGAAFPLLSTALSLATRSLVSGVPFALYVPAVVFATYLGGLGPGILSLALSAGLCGYYLIAPYDAFGPSQAEVAVVSLFLVIGGVLCWIAAALRDGYLERAAHAHRFESLVATSSDVIWTATPEGLAREDSPSWRDFTGQSLEEYRDAGWLDAVHPDDRPRVALAWREAVARRDRFELEYRLRRRGGGWAPVVARGAPVIDARGRVVEWVGASSDLSARDAAEAAQRESEEWFRTLLGTIPQMVWTADATGRTQFQNPQIREYTGKGDEELANGRWRTLVHREDRAPVVAFWRRMRDEQIGGDGTFRLLGRDGAYRWFLVRAAPLRGADGRLRQWVGTLTDIHLQKASEDAKNEAIRARDVFLSVASHELKTPVAAALLQIQQAHRLLRRQGTSPELAGVTQRVAASAASVERLGSLVGTLLDVSRIATGKLELERKRFDLTESVTQVAARLAETADRARCPLEVDVAPGIAALGDRLRVEQVITNLLANAMKYGAGSPIALALARRDGVAVLTVADRGIGIAPEDQLRIFEPFERAVSARHYGGLGLGLWIAREIIEAGGGAIRVESRPSQGSTFHVELPLA